MGNCCFSMRSDKQQKRDQGLNEKHFPEMDEQIQKPLQKQQSAPVPSRLKIKETANIHKAHTAEGFKTLNDYMLLETLGEGSYGKVRLADKNGQKYAVKILNKSKLKKKREFYVDENGANRVKDALENVRKEIAIMKKMRHNNIIRLFEVLDNPDSNKIYMVMEYAAKGQCIEWDEELQNFYYTGDEQQLDLSTLRSIFRDIVKGLHYMHSHNIAHRDLKPQNIFFDEQMKAKIGDFGVSQVIQGETKTDNTAGTYHFMAPESFNIEPFCPKATDIWALGVTFFTFIYLKIPFNGQSIDQIMEAIQTQEVVFPSDEFKSANQMIKKCLQKDPQKRITIDGLLDDPFLNEGEQIPLRDQVNQEKVLVDEAEIQNAYSVATFVMIKAWVNKWKGTKSEKVV